MKTLIHRNIIHPASALVIIALCAALGTASFGAGKWPSKKDDDKKESKKPAVQTTTKQSGSPTSTRPSSSSQSQGTWASLAAKRQAEVAAKANAPRVTPTAVQPDRGSTWGNRGSVQQPANPVRTTPTSPAVTPRSTGGSTAYRPESKGPNTNTTTPKYIRPSSPTTQPRRDDNRGPVVNRPSSDRPSVAYRPESKNPDVRVEPRRGDSNRTAYRPDTDSRRDYREQPRGTTQPKRASDARVYRPAPEGSRPSYTTEAKIAPKVVLRPNRSYKPSGAPVTYRPSANTTYRGRFGGSYYRPTYVEPKSYRPPTYRSGHWYYVSHYHPRPRYYGYWAFDYSPNFCRRSIYFHFGYFPYVQVTRVYETSYPEVVFVDRPVYVNNGYYLETQKYQAVDETLADIRSAWISGRYDLIERHVIPQDKVAIFLDGEYDYSIDGDDYLNMTRDALEELQTVSFVWEKVQPRNDGTITAFGTHQYLGGSNAVRTVYVSYTLDRIGGNYYIVEVGSSLTPIY